MVNSKVHFLLIKIDSAFFYDKYLSFFSPEIINKIKSYRFYKDQITAFASELIKRYYLAKYLKTFPRDLAFGYTLNHRPFLLSHENIDFNISHCGEYILLGICHAAKIGVDIEKIDTITDITELSKIAFSPAENLLINSQPANFIKLWTKKEALLKMLGVGFSNDLYQTTELTLADFEVYNGIMIFTSLVAKNYLCGISLKN